ncbi:MAG: hypothetical protein AAGD14_16785 [Planctomycetota bacterium]
MRAIGIGVVVGLVLVACGGGGDDEGNGLGFTPQEEQAAECIVFNLDDLEDVAVGLIQLAEGLGIAPLPSNITFDPGTGNYSIIAALLGGGTRSITGTVTGDDLTDGFAIGESFQATWTALGNGTFQVSNNSATEIRLQGTGTVQSGVNCTTAVTVDVMIDPTVVGDLVVTGTIDFTAQVAGGETATGTITFDGTSIADVEAMFMGETQRFRIDLDEFEAIP